MISHSANPPNRIPDLMEYFEEMDEVKQANRGAEGGAISANSIYGLLNKPFYANPKKRQNDHILSKLKMSRVTLKPISVWSGMATISFQR